MKWGVIRKCSSKPKEKYDASSLTNEELKKRIARLRLEDDYENLISEENKFRITRGHKFIADVLKDSSTNVYKQMEKYVKEKEKRGLGSDDDSKNK